MNKKIHISLTPPDVTKLNKEEFSQTGYQYTIMYIARMHSLTEFLMSKIISAKDGYFSNYEVSETIEAYVVKIVCDWEWYVEKVLYECLKDDTSKLASHLGITLPEKISTDECLGYLNGLGFFDVKNIGQLKNISRKILHPSKNPFVHIKNEAKTKIDEFYTLRNHVAHRSNPSKRALLKLYKKYNIKEDKNVGEFLIAPVKDRNNLILLQDYGASYWLGAMNIMEFLYPKIYKWIVEDEKVYNDACHYRLHMLMSVSPNQPLE